MSKIGLVFNGVWSQYTFAKAEKYRSLFELIYIYDLAETDLSGFSALAIPFQNNHQVLNESKQKLYDFLADGNKIFVEGDSSAGWLDAAWEDRPVNNFWWVKNPENPPVSYTLTTHPIYAGLKPRHACWHTHGAYVRIPEHAMVIQENALGEVITWQTNSYGGTLLVTTLDPIVEHGIQQITHLDNYVDRLIEWLIGEQPTGEFSIHSADYGISWK